MLQDKFSFCQFQLTNLSLKSEYGFLRGDHSSLDCGPIVSDWREAWIVPDYSSLDCGHIVSDWKEAWIVLGKLETTPAQGWVYMMKNVLSSAEHGRCPHKYQKWEQYLRAG